jgi:hypothetical protein
VNQLARVGRRSYPLRKILYSKTYNRGELCLGLHDYLECGHVIPQAQDIYGFYYPKERRCHKCSKGKERDFELKN